MTKFKGQIKKVKTVNELPNYWTTEDFKHLLEAFDFPEAEKIKEENRAEYLKMAISEYEPAESAAILLNYKLGNKLNEGQIDQISNDMLIDKISEEYPEIDIHEDLFSINQFLYKAYNGTFLNVEATIITAEINPDDEQFDLTDKEFFLKVLAPNLSGSNIIKRLFSDQLEKDEPFPEANDIIWQLEKIDGKQYRALTSDYWISASDIISPEFEVELELENK